MSIYRIFITFLGILCGFATAVSQNVSSYDFLNVTSSARIYGLGGINISTVEDNLETTDQNPALLGGEMSGWIDVNYMRYLGDSNFAGLKYAGAIGEHGAWLAGLQYFGYGKVDETDEYGTVLGSFSPMDATFSGMVSYDVLSRLRIGATVKFIYSSYNGFNALALATDLGLNYYDPDHDFSFSVVGANLGGQLKRFENTYEHLPIDLRIGFTYGLRNIPLRFSLTAWNLTKWSGRYKPFMDHFVIGVDLVPSTKFYASIGYNYMVRDHLQGYQKNFFSGFTLGAGFSSSRFNIGAAIAQPHAGGFTFLLNLGLKLHDVLH